MKTMKKVVIVAFVLLIPAICWSQSLMEDIKLDMKVLNAPISVENNSRVENLTVYPAELLEFDENITTLNEDEVLRFSTNIGAVTGTFPYMIMGSKADELMETLRDTSQSIFDWTYDNVVKSTEVYVDIEFLSEGQKVVQTALLEVEEEKGRKGSDKFKATINDSHLGLRTVEVQVENPLNIPFFLENEDLGFSIVVDEEGKAELLNSEVIPDGVHEFKVTMSLPVGMVPGESLNLLVKGNKILFPEGISNPFDFGSHTIFSDKRSTVRLKNTRNEPVTVLIPESFVDEGRETSDSETIGGGNDLPVWKGVNIEPGKTTRVDLPRGTTVRIVVQSQRQTNLANLRIQDRPNQLLTIGW
jgi:hypothetical protein